MVADRARARWVWTALIGGPVLSLLAGIWLTVDAVTFLAASRKAEAEVVEVLVERRGHGVRVSRLRSFLSPGSGVVTPGERVYDEGYTAVVRFEADGAEVVAPTHIQSDSYDYEIGRTVTIRYDPDDLSSVRVAGIWSLWAFPLTFTGLGAAMLVMVWKGRGQIERQLRGGR